MARCNRQCEVYSRVVGYHRPVQNWNHGKKEEFKERIEFNIEKSVNNLKNGTSEQQAESIICENQPN